MEYRYKDSGIEWIGRIPKNWNTCRLKDCAIVVLGKMLMNFPPKGQESAYTLERYLKSKNIGWLEIILDNGVDEMWFNIEEKKTYLLKNGDIVMNEGGDIGKVALWIKQPYDCYIQNSVHKITAGTTVNNYFLLYFLYYASSKGYFNSIVNQISIAHLTKEKLQNTPITLPTLSEQKRIAKYLDWKCGEIDELITLQEQMIALLTNYKQSVITETITKGLNPNVSFVPSGIDWIGQMPKDWKITNMKNLCTSITDGSHFSPERQSEGMPYITAGDVRGKGIDYDKAMRITIEDYNILESQGCRPHKGDVLMVKDGATTGRVGIMTDDEECVLLSSVAMLTPKENVDSYYLMYLIQSDIIQAQIRLLMAGSAMPRVTLKKINTLKGLLISIDEQRAIAKYLDAKCGEIDMLIVTKQKKIDTLKEYKKSVIYEAVTGKVNIE